MTLIKKALAVVCTLSLTLGALSGCSGKLTEGKVSVLSEHTSEDGFNEAYDNIVLENDRLRFEMDISTTHFIITDKNSGKQYYSVSQESDSVDDAEAARMQSEVTLCYYEEQSDAMYMFSDTDSVQSGNFRVLTDGDSIRVYYSMGFVDALVPKVLDTDTFELLMDKLGSDSLRRRFERYYVLYSSKEKSDDLSEQIKKYPILKKQDLYILSDSLSDIELNDISDYIAQTDFSKEDYLKTLKKLGIEYESGSDSAGFMVPIEYSLTEDGFSARILIDLIEETSDEYKLQSIDLLEYFASVRTSEGYFLVPDGSGAIVPFSQEGGQLSMPYYGENYTKNTESASVFTNNLTLPVFGISLSDGGIFAEIKKGSEASTLNLSIVSEASTCNHIFTSFEIRALDSTDYGANMQIPIYNLFAKERVASNLEIQYHLLTADSNDYSDMAALYREAASFEETDGYDDAPVYVDYLCMITEEASMMGVPYTKKIVLSTIDEIYSSVEKLIKADIGPVIVRLFGYSSSGAEHKAYSKFQLDKNVGTVSQVKELKDLLEENGGKLCFDTDMQFAYEGGNGFSVSDNSARYLNRLVVCRGDHNIVSRAYSSNQLRYLISPLYYSSIAESMMNSLDKKLGKVGLSYGSSGVYLGGDYAKGRNLDRCESADLTAQALNKAKENGFEMAFDVGNAYVLPYASHLLNVPADSSEYKLEEKSVPFYQMVLHGSISYSGSPYNMSANNLDSVCDSYAFGSAPYAVFITEDDKLIANTSYETKWYSLDDGKRLEGFIETAKKTYDLRTNTVGSRIIGYAEISDGVSLTSYDNGIKVYVNRNNTELTINGTTVPANGFTVGGN